MNNRGLAEAFTYWFEYGQKPIVCAIHNNDTPVGFICAASISRQNLSPPSIIGASPSIFLHAT